MVRIIVVASQQHNFGSKSSISFLPLSSQVYIMVSDSEVVLNLNIAVHEIQYIFVY